MHADLVVPLPNSKYLTALAYAKRGEETAQLHVKHQSIPFFTQKQANSAERFATDIKLLLSGIRRTSKGLNIVLREVHAKDEYYSEAVTTVLSLILQVCDRTISQLEALDLPESVKEELDQLEDQLIQLEDFVENLQLSSEIKGLYDHTAESLAKRK